jgi:hypothetical protein
MSVYWNFGASIDTKNLYTTHHWPMKHKHTILNDSCEQMYKTNKHILFREEFINV